MRILITGATGFLGSHLARRLRAEGHAVRILRRADSSLHALEHAGTFEIVSTKNLPSDFDHAIGDITDAASVDRAVAGCEVVFHCAALISYHDHRNAEQVAINVRGTQHVVDACVRHRVRCLIHVSSIAAIGVSPRDGALADETTSFDALAKLRMNYAETKRAAESVVQRAIREQALHAVIINPGTIYGPGDQRRIAYIRGLTQPVSAAGGIGVVDVDDVVEGAIRAWQRGRCGERYVLVAENWRHLDVGRAFARALGQHGPRCVVPTICVRLAAHAASACAAITQRESILTPTMARAAGATFFFSNAKSRAELGMEYRPFVDTVARTAAWLRTTRI